MNTTTPEELRRSLPADYNPRVSLWLRAVGLERAAIEREPGRDSVLVPDADGHPLPWSILFSEWIMAQWRAWAASLGFVRNGGYDAHHLAQFAGHTAAEFDAWLVERVAAGLTPARGRA